MSTAVSIVVEAWTSRWGVDAHDDAVGLEQRRHEVPPPVCAHLVPGPTAADKNQLQDALASGHKSVTPRPERAHAITVHRVAEVATVPSPRPV